MPETKPRPEQPDRSQTMSGPSAPRPVPKVSFTPGLLGRRGGRPTIRSIAVVWVSRKVATLFFLTHRDHEDRPAVPGLRTHRLFIRREQPVRVQLATPRLLTAAQVPRIGFLVLKGCCQTGCRQGGVGRVLSDPPQQLGQASSGPQDTAVAGLASCGPRPRGSGRPWPARGVLGRGTPPASRQAAPAARASRGGRGSGPGTRLGAS